MRTIVTIDDKEAAVLAELCQQKGWSRAKGIREGIRLLIQKMHHPDTGEEEAFGLWANDPTDGVEYQRNLRSDWDRD